MKKVLLSIACLLSITAVKAQIRFGPEIGLNMATAVEAGYSSSFKFGVRAGGIVDIPLGDHFALQPGIFYTMMGSKYTGSIALGGSSGDLTLNYIYIPIDVLYKFGESGDGRFFIGLGPEIGYCLGGKETLGSASYTLKVGSGKDANVKPLDYGLNGLVGYELPMGLTFKVGYYAGFADIQSDASKSLGASTTLNYALQISAAWLFGGSSY
ncbi:MAG: PorT family protein [Taibaiella sp.]|nr:PorT family protein [Taibaiella sp.]